MFLINVYSSKIFFVGVPTQHAYAYICLYTHIVHILLYNVEVRKLNIKLRNNNYNRKIN